MAEPMTVASLVRELDKRKESFAAELKPFLTTSLETSLAPIQTSLGTIKESLDSHIQNLTVIENTPTSHSEELAELTAWLDNLEKKKS